MNAVYCIGLDIHKKTISYCIKAVEGRLVGKGKVDADRRSLGELIQHLPGAWIGAMEATIFTGWVCESLKPYALELKVAHSRMPKAITAAKKKNYRVDAGW